MTAAARTAPVTADDRLALTVCVAILVHAMIVLGISFAPEQGASSRFETLEVILVPERSPKAPENADLLAQANLEGGGNATESARPAAPIKAPLPAPTAEIAATPPPPMQAVPTSPTKQPPTARNEKGRAVVKEKVAIPAAHAALAMPKQAERTPTTDKTEEPTPATAPPQPAVDNEPLPTAAQLLTRSFALASLSAELQQRLDDRAKRPRRKYVSANTKEYKYAAYMEAWRAKVERVGNLNYPDDARKNRLTGNLILDVALNADGSVNQITIRRSSGSKILDDAAVRIVELSSPFAPFPSQIREETDILHITRTWQFLNNISFK